MKTLLKLILILLCLVYLLNLGAGFLEFIPDNLPFVGNLDEGAAVAFLLYLLRSLRRPGKPTPAPPTIDV